MSGEIEVRRQQIAASRQMVHAYGKALADLLPRTGVSVTAFEAHTMAALDQNPDLAAAAAVNAGSLMGALMKCAMLGHVPATNDYALVPYGVKNGEITGKTPTVTGIEQYQGLLKRVQRAAPGTVVRAEVIRRADTFARPEVLGDPPVHVFDPLDPIAKRGPVIGVYAYAKLPTGHLTDAVILSEEDIDTISRNTPFWREHPVQMRKKSAILRLKNFLPTSAEWMEVVGLAHAEVAKVAAEQGVAIPNLDEHPDLMPPEPPTTKDE